MLALSIRQPWAWLITEFNGHDPKRMENRKWYTKYRGWILIHAAITYDTAGAKWVRNEFGITVPGPGECKAGGIVGSAYLKDVVKASKSRWFQGPFAFVLTRVYPLPFTFCPGQLGLFEYPPANETPRHEDEAQLLKDLKDED